MLNYGQHSGYQSQLANKTPQKTQSFKVFVRGKSPPDNKTEARNGLAYKFVNTEGELINDDLNEAFGSRMSSMRELSPTSYQKGGYGTANKATP